MKKFLLLTTLFLIAFSLQSFSSDHKGSESTKKTTTSEIQSAPYVYDITYNDNGSIVVEIRCDHICRVKVTPTRQIEDYYTEAAKYVKVSTHDCTNCEYYATVTFSCKNGSVGSQCRTYDFKVTEI